MDYLDVMFVVCAFLFQVLLIIHFALRKWRFDTAMRFGPVVYKLSIPAFLVSILLISGGKPWSMWLSGLLYLAWAIFGYTVEYVYKIEWRNALRWPILIPYISLYLATVMFYWFPTGMLYKPLWYVYDVLFLISTYLNITSHKRSPTSIKEGEMA